MFTFLLPYIHTERLKFNNNKLQLKDLPDADYNWGGILRKSRDSKEDNNTRELWSLRHIQLQQPLNTDQHPLY